MEQLEKFEKIWNGELTAKDLDWLEFAPFYQFLGEKRIKNDKDDSVSSIFDNGGMK